MKSPNKQSKKRRRNSFSKITKQLSCLDLTWHTADSESLCGGGSQHSAHRYEDCAAELLRELNQEIYDLNQAKKKLNKIIDSSLELAIARHAHGSCNRGSLLSLRKMSHAMTRKAYTAAARFQLIEIRQQIQGDLDCLNLTSIREKINEILDQLEIIPCRTPSDENLLKYLAEYTD